MPRKSAAAELQAEEAVVNSPVRRSSRIVSGNGSTPAGVAKRRTSQSTEPQADTPARATRGRRASSAQDTEEKIETKPVARTRRASVLAEEEAQKDTLTPTRRSRKPSVDVDETEKPKPVRGRRTSTASKSDEPEGEKPVKTAAVRTRRSSANVEVEVEVKVAPKTPARTTSRRRSSVTENTITEEVPTAAKRTARGRKASDAEIAEEVKKPGARRGRKTSTDDVLAKTPPKTPGRPRRSSVNKEIEVDELSHKRETDTQIQKANPTNDNGSTEEEMSPIILKDLAVKVTPLKKRKILEKVEAELDLSIINESSDDINSSKQDESLKERTESGSVENVITRESNHDPKTTNATSQQTDSSPINKNVDSVTSPTTKRLASESIDISSPRKSPRLTEKLSKNNTPRKEEGGQHKVPIPRRSRNLLKENDKELSVTEHSLLSSGSDGSFKFHLSNVSMANSSRQDSNKESTQDDLLNISKESTGSNKENIEIADSLNMKDGLETSVVVSPVPEPKVVLARISNVFKPNQKDYSFMEPMEVDENSICFDTSRIEKCLKVDDSLVGLNQKLEKVQSAEVTTNYVIGNSSDLDESIIFNHKTSNIKTDVEKADLLKEVIPNRPQSPEILSLASDEDALKQNLTEAEGSDTNLLIEETQDRVDFSIKPKTKNIEISTSNIIQRRSKSPTSTDASLIINQPLEQVKVVLSGKSSSPIISTRKSASFRKSKSPIPEEANSTESENDDQNRLSVARPARKSKSASRSPSPSKKFKAENNDVKTLVTRRSKSKSVSPSPNKRKSHSDKEDVKQSRLSVGRTSMSKSPDSTGISIDKDPEDSDNIVVPQRSKSRSLSPIKRSPSFMLGIKENKLSLERPIKNVDSLTVSRRSKSKSRSPSSGRIMPDIQKTPVTRADNKLKQRRSARSKSKSPLSDYQETKSPLPDDRESPVDRSNDTVKMRRSVSKSPLPEVLISEQSFEKPKGLDEILVTTEQKPMKPSTTVETTNVESPNTSMENLPDASSTYSSKIPENEIEVSGSDCTMSEHTNIQDKTEYHTAVATTNNDSDFNSLLNTDNEVAQSHLKDSESTHYDFDLDSDDDDSQSRNGRRAFAIETSILEKKSLKLQKEFEDQSQDVIELKKSSERKSTSSKNALNETKSILEDAQAKEFNKVSRLNTNKPLETDDLDKDNVFKENDSNLQDDVSNIQDDITCPIKSTNRESLRNETSLDKEDAVILNESHSNDKSKLVNSTVELEDKKEDTSNGVCNMNVTISEKSVLDKNNEEDASISLCKINLTIADKSISEENVKADASNISSIDQLEKPRNSREVENIDVSKNREDKKQAMQIKDHEDCRSSKEDITKSLQKEIEHNDDVSVIMSKDDCKTLKPKKRQLDDKQSKRKKRSAEPTPSSETKIMEVVKEVNTSQKNATEDGNTCTVNTKLPLDEFASSKLDEYLNSKGSDLEGSSSEEEEGEEEESEEEYNEFIDGMAEEGEEDTPSEDSNQIIDEGESIGSSSEGDDTDDEYDPNDSFICDDDVTDLLSGNEYDLGHENKKNKKSRIIDSNTLGDEDIIKIPKKKKEVIEKSKKRSRIITVSDSSEEDQELIDSKLKPKEESLQQDIEKVEDRSLIESVILIEDSKDEISNANLIEDSRKEDTSKVIVIEESKCENTSETNKTTEESKVEDFSKSVLIEKVTDKSNDTEVSNSQPLPINVSVDNLNTSLQKRHRKSSLSIQENILLDGVKDSLITKRISTLVESFCSTVKKGEVSLNLSLEYEDSGEKPTQEEKTEAVHILSDIKICPSYPLVSQEGNVVLQEKEEVLELEENSMEKEPLSASLNDIVDLREVINKKNLKRRLSKSLDEMNEEVKASKRRKQDKNQHKDNQKEKTSRATITKTKKKDKVKEDAAKALRNAISSFSIMDQLITDVKNRPRRVIKPSQTGTEAESSWTTTKVTNLKPSTSAVAKQEKIKIPPKLHPKDFKNQMLSDNKRIKRVDTKTLLKKKGAY